MVDVTDNVQGGEKAIVFNMVDVVDGAQDRDGQKTSSPKRDLVGNKEDNFEPHDSVEFESHEAAYSFYQEYAKSMGFTTSIKNSRRSKKTKEFIDAKFACSRYGVTPESDSTSSRRPSVRKTDCKASMHVKRNRGGNWYIHEFIKEHNHELLPALAYHFRIHKNVKLAEKNNIDILHAVSERTRKMYVEMYKQSGGLQNLGLIKNEFDHQFDRGSISEEGYNIAYRALGEALKNCVNVNRSAADYSSNAIALRCAEEENQIVQVTKTNKKSTNKKRKLQSEPGAVFVEAQGTLQQMENFNSDGNTLNSYYGSQQSMHGLLNLMEPPHDAYYVSQQNMQGLGQLNSVASSHEGFFESQQSMTGLGHLDFRPPSFSYGLQDEPNVRSTQLHGTARHV
ncbi:unnamed protein product [Fraxinus pennsylvanica]|uniref:FAR1 domain-containing protein n=1 Tax=Fraxinus pennsylvanica TaxID=56036 RepID=A0AAD1ZN98_9LAMI|nr:unnamed protein product [Fraxinus pennsylvanica]